MNTMNFKTAIFIGGTFFLFLLGNQVFGQEHPAPSSKSNPKQLSKQELSEAVKDYIQKESKKNGGYFQVEAPADKKTLKLTLEKVHDDRLASIGNDVYFVCADFKGTDGNL